MKKIAGGCLIFIGLFMMLGMFVSQTSHGFIVESLTFLLFVVAPLIGGSLLIRNSGLRKKQAAEEAKKLLHDSREKEIFRLAKEKGGFVTLAEVVSETSMNSSEAEDMLNDLVIKRMADLKMSPDGQVAYEFFDSLPSDDVHFRKDELDLLKE